MAQKSAERDGVPTEHQLLRRMLFALLGGRRDPCRNHQRHYRRRDPFDIGRADQTNNLALAIDPRWDAVDAVSHAALTNYPWDNFSITRFDRAR